MMGRRLLRVVKIVQVVSFLLVLVFASRVYGWGAPAPAPADLEQVWGAVVQFFQDTRLHIILGLIGLDLVMGIAVAIKLGTFKWEMVGRFYQTMILPYIIGYLALYVAFALVPGGLEGILGQGLATTAFGLIVAHLAGSIFANLQALGFAKQAEEIVEVAPSYMPGMQVTRDDMQGLAEAGFIKCVEEDGAGRIRYVFKEPDETEEEGT